MQGVMTEMGEWPAYHWGGNADLTAQCKNTVRLATSLLRRKLEWADTVPYILCRVHQPGVALQALAQYDRLSDHHPVTEYYLKPGSPFRAQIEQIPVEGVPEAALSVDLRRQWAPIFFQACQACSTFYLLWSMSMETPTEFPMFPGVCRALPERLRSGRFEKQGFDAN